MVNGNEKMNSVSTAYIRCRKLYYFTVFGHSNVFLRSVLGSLIGKLEKCERRRIKKRINYLLILRDIG